MGQFGCTILSVDTVSTSTPYVISRTRSCLRFACSQILAPHRNVIHECQCVFVIEASSFSAMMYVLTDLLLVVKLGKGNKLKPRLLMWHTKMLIGACVRRQHFSFVCVAFK